MAPVIPLTAPRTRRSIDNSDQLAAFQVIHLAGARLVQDQNRELAVEVPAENVDEEFVWALEKLGLCGLPITERDYPLEMGPSTSHE
jgi:hypothetical protein